MAGGSRSDSAQRTMNSGLRQLPTSNGVHGMAVNVLGRCVACVRSTNSVSITMRAYLNHPQYVVAESRSYPCGLATGSRADSIRSVKKGTGTAPAPFFHVDRQHGRQVQQLPHTELAYPFPYTAKRM